MRLLFWNRYSTEQRVDLDQQDTTTACADTMTAAAGAADGACVNSAYSADDDAVSTHTPHGLTLALSSCVCVSVLTCMTRLDCSKG